MRKKRTSTKYEAAVYQEDPDAIATVHVFDPDQNKLIPVEVGYYYHGKSGSTIYLQNDPRTKQMLWEASEVHLTRFTRTRPTSTKPERNPKPAASYRPIAGPTR